MVDDNYNYYIISFGTDIDASDPSNIVTKTHNEHFYFIGTYLQYFEELMGAKDRLPTNVQSIMHQVSLSSRYNPQRHIRTYGVKSMVKENELRSLCISYPDIAEKTIRECSILI